jgi:Zn-dependent oligopeptidase
MALPKETLEKIREAIRKTEEIIKDLEPDIADARRAGIDVTEQVKRLRQLQAKLAGLKAVYGE